MNKRRKGTKMITSTPADYGNTSFEFYKQWVNKKIIFMKDDITLNELIKRLQAIVEMNPKSGELIVYIPVEATGFHMGGTPSVSIYGASQGIDWDSSKVFLFPSHDLIKPEPIINDCTHEALTDTGNGFYVCTNCKQGWSYSEWDYLVYVNNLTNENR